MKELFEALDQSRDGLISKTEFLEILNIPRAVLLLEEVGIDVIFLLDQSDTIFGEDSVIPGKDPEEETKLSFESLMELILDLRGTTHATVKHIVQLRKQLLAAIANTHSTLAEME